MHENMKIRTSMRLSSWFKIWAYDLNVVNNVINGNSIALNKLTDCVNNSTKHIHGTNTKDPMLLLLLV